MKAWIFILGMIGVVVGIVLWPWLGARDSDGGSYVSLVDLDVLPKQEEKPDLRQMMMESISELTATASGKYAWAVKDITLDEGEVYGQNMGDKMSAASIFKVPAMLSVLQLVEKNEASLSSTLVMVDSLRRSGSGPLQFLASGSRFSLEKAMLEMGRTSDNTAWAHINAFVGMKNISELVSSMGLKNSSYDDLDTTVLDVVLMWEKIYRSEIITQENKEKMWRWLSDSIYEDRITRGIDKKYVLAHKVGTDTGVWSDSGIVSVGERKIAVAVMTSDAVRQQAVEIVPKIAELIWQYEMSKP